MKIIRSFCWSLFLQIILLQPLFSFYQCRFNIIKEYKQFASDREKKLLLKEQEEKNNQLYKSITKGNLSEIKQALVDGADINAHDKFKIPPLFCALYQDRDYVSEEIVTYLLDQGANPNMRNGHSEIPLMRVIELKKCNLLKLFLEHPAIDITITSHKFETIWHYAIKFYDPIIFAELYSDQRCRMLLSQVSDNLLFDVIRYQQEHPNFYMLLVKLIALPEIAKNAARKRSGDTIIQAILRAPKLTEKKQSIMLLLHWFPTIDIWHRDGQGLTAYELSKILNDAMDIQLFLLWYMKSVYQTPQGIDIRWQYWD